VFTHTGSFVVWTIPSPWRVRALGAARLVSTPSRQPFGRSAWLGIASEGFPEFEQFYSSGFPVGTQFSSLSPLRLPIPPRPRTETECTEPVAHRQE
jgi:hypothetical protein